MNPTMNPSFRPEGMDEERKEGGPPHVSQNYTINKNILYDDDEFNVNIEDVDLTVKTWSNLISSFLMLMQNLMSHKIVNQVIKSRISRKNEPSGIGAEINEIRNKIIFKFFE